METDPIATIDEVKDAMKAQWKLIFHHLLAFTISLCKNHDLAVDLIGRAVEKLLDGTRHWNKVKKPELKKHMFNAVGSEWANHCAAEARDERRGWKRSKRDVDRVPESSRDPEKMKLKELDDAARSRVFDHARVSLTGDVDTLGLLDAVMGDATIDPELLEDGKRFDLARRRLKYAIEKAIEEVGES